jgi:hypothetical protein
MRDFSKISPAVWDSERFMSMTSDDSKFLYLYLLSCRHQNSAGVFHLKDAYAAADLRWTVERYQTARLQLVEADLVHFDEKASVVLITRWFKHNPPMNASHQKGVIKVIQRIECEAFRLEALEALHEAYEAQQTPKAPEAPKEPQNTPGGLPVAPVANISPAMKDNLTRRGWDNTRGAA